MKRKIFTPILMLAFGLFQLQAVAQNEVEKLNETFNVDSDVQLDLNSKQTHVIIETWNKDKVEVVAKVVSENLSEEELQEVANQWNVKAIGNSNKVTISSQGSAPGIAIFPGNSPNVRIMRSDEIANMVDVFVSPLMNEVIKPMIMGAKSEPLPPKFYESLGGLNFDYEAYQDEGEEYIERYEKLIEKRFGKDFEKAMEEWGKNFEKKQEAWAESFERKMEAMERSDEFKKRQEAFEKRMEEWAERFGKQMGGWAKELEDGEAKMTQTVTMPDGTKIIEMSYSKSDSRPSPKKVESDIKKLLVIKMPKEALANLNVRYGDLLIEDEVTNLRANISHAGITAKQLSGKSTQLSVDYSPIAIETWEYGTLNLNYVKDCSIENVKSIKLAANASDVMINTLEETGIIAGSFGDLIIENTGKDFKRLDINLENSDLVLKLPETSFNFTYNGSRSDVKYPEKLKANVTDSYGNQLINGYHKSRNTDNMINISAKFSDVLIK